MSCSSVLVRKTTNSNSVADAEALPIPAPDDEELREDATFARRIFKCTCAQDLPSKAVQAHFSPRKPSLRCRHLGARLVTIPARRESGCNGVAGKPVRQAAYLRALRAGDQALHVRDGIPLARHVVHGKQQVPGVNLAQELATAQDRVKLQVAALVARGARARSSELVQGNP